MYGETIISYVKVLNRPIETTIFKWMFQVAGTTMLHRFPESKFVVLLVPNFDTIPFQECKNLILGVLNLIDFFCEGQLHSARF